MTFLSHPQFTDRVALTRAVMVLLGLEGLRIPGMDFVSGQEVHPAIPLELSELLLLSALFRGGQTIQEYFNQVSSATGAAPESLLTVIEKLAERRLLVAEAEPRTTPTSESVARPQVSAQINPVTPLLVRAPQLLRLAPDGFDFLDHHGHLQASLSAIELAAVSEFRSRLTVEKALDNHRRTCGPLALDEAAFQILATRLVASGLLQLVELPVLVSHDSFAGQPVRREGRPTLGRERANEQEWLRFQTLNARVRDTVKRFEAAEREREESGARKRVKVVPVQHNGTVFPLALGMIVAYARAYDGGALNDHYAFYPDWLMRPAKVRSLVNEPVVFLFSNYNWSHRHNQTISRKVKELSPFSLTIHGGPNTPKYEVDNETYFRENPDVDITVRGEGEAAVADLLSALKDVIGQPEPNLSVLMDVPGISFRLGDKVIHTRERPRITDLDTIPSPLLLDLFLPYEGTPLGIVETNRGCPFSCTFCDWGSAIATKVRKFKLDRVFSELEWCARHEIAGIMIADANFGMYERDVLIAEKVAELKQKYGYPNGFSVSAAKNTTKYTKQIIEILADAQVMSKGSIGVQSMDPETLTAIKRSNIRIDKYDEIASEFRKAVLPLWVDLMFGLPGQTVKSFQNDLQGCINRGVFPRVFMTELLVNSPMNEPQYRERHQIKTELSPDGFKQLVVSTTSFTRVDYEEMKDLLQLFMLCDAIGILRQLAHFVRSETGMREIDFYEGLRQEIRNHPERWPVLAFSVRALPALLIPPTSWDLIIQEARRYVTEVLKIPDDTSLQTTLTVQHALLPARDRVMPQTLQLAHDYASWYSAIVDALNAGHHDDWPDTVPKLREFKPASFYISDPDQLCTLGIGAAVDGDLFGNYELWSPVARWVRADQPPTASATAATQVTT